MIEMDEPDQDQYEGSRIRWAAVGFVLAASLPMALGIYGLIEDIVFRPVVPAPPGAGTCGLGTLASIALVVVVGPVCGLVGAVFGSLAATIANP